MSDYTNMIKADAYLRFSYEYTDTGGGSTFGPTTPTISGPYDYGDTGLNFMDIILAQHYPPPDPPDEPYNGNAKTIVHLINVGHIMPMKWTVTRSVYDLSTDAFISSDTSDYTLVDTADFTFETDGEGTYATFTYTFRTPA